MALHRSPFAVLVLALTSLVTTGCEEEITGLGDERVEGQFTFDATDPAAFSYLTFDGEGGTVAVADPQDSDAWVLAFRRFSVKLNGGVAGSRGVGGFNLGNNADADSASVVNFTRSDADAAWEAVGADAALGVSFVQDDLVEDESGPWFRYDPIAATLVANTGAAWKVREADGGFAVFRVSDMALAGQLLGTIQLEYRRQDAGGTLGAIEKVDVAFPAGPPAPVFIDLESGTSVTPAGCNWDVSVAPYFVISFNADCSAGTFPLDATDDFTAISRADDASKYAGFLSVISGAVPSTIEGAGGVFWYGIAGANRLSPTFNVFLLQVDDAVFKFQVLDYYNASGESGHPTVRFERLR
jgi:hypothetical protein